MELRTYRAATMHEALAQVRRDLGPEAAVLHTREVRDRWLGVLPGRRRIEVTASREVNVPSRLRQRTPAEPALRPQPTAQAADETKLSRQVQGQLSTLQAMMKDLCRRSKDRGRGDWPEEYFRLFTDLLDVDVGEDVARELVERVRIDPSNEGLCDPMMLKARVAGLIEDDVPIAGPIRITPGRCRLAALVGPTGVGKTTTIAKLAANFRLKEKRRVGLITVDTYRIAAVEQLRTYADIIDLPMHVVSTQREMRETVKRMDHLDLILLDTAGRSPKDEIRIQELKMFLNDARADEVHLVLSSGSGARTLEQAAEQFAVVGPTSLILTKLDESGGLGNVLPLLRNRGLPLSYLTDGQNVPDDIQTADAHRLARMILQFD
ncbi:MAG: flagellar biosynthesis protein FlhF [Pirellulales bacterium]|nr:flagellar biosynthesis protein FlhF [Pirellulales bacterium]